MDQIWCVQVARAIALLESNGHLGPFVGVFGMDAFIEAYTPEPGSLVMPSDRIAPLLGSSLLRSSVLSPGQVVIVSLAGDPIDLLIATAPAVQFLYVTDEARFVFRVYERFALRIKESNTVCSFTLAVPPTQQK